MSKKRKHDDDIKLEDVKTHEDKMKYSRMMMRKWEEAGERGLPSAFLDFPLEDPAKPWMQPEWHIMIERAERERQRLLRRGK